MAVNAAPLAQFCSTDELHGQVQWSVAVQLALVMYVGAGQPQQHHLEDQDGNS